MTNKIQGGVGASRKCPDCHNRIFVKCGTRDTENGLVQRYRCKDCGRRFSESTVLSTDLNNSGECQVGEFLTEGSKNLAEVEPPESGLAGATKKTDIRGKSVEFAWWMKKQGYADTTIRLNVSCLRTLETRGADLYDSESVKDVIARQNWSESRRRNVINAYSLFLRFYGMQWEKPRCKVTKKLPFIPTEQELDTLIAGSGKKTSTFLQLLKETAMRSGEAKKVLWIDVNFENRLITLNYPEKGGDPRVWKISARLIGMMKHLPRNSLKIFGDSTLSSMRTTFNKSRKRLAIKLQNPRLLRISFHTLRHWKATMEYHKTRDAYHVKRFLGHKNIQNTDIYINIEQAIFNEESDEFHVKVAGKTEEVKTLLEVGFQYVCEKNGLMFFRKRK